MRKKIELSKEQIQKAFEQTPSNGKAAKVLNVSYQTLMRRCEELGIVIKKNPSGKGLTAAQRYGDEKAKVLAKQLAARGASRECSAITRSKLRDAALLRIDNGKMPSKGLKGRYDGIWFDSSWELAYYIWMSEICQVKPQRNTKIFFDYVDLTGVKRRTKPDFVLPTGELIEIKGYPNIHTEAKIAATKDEVKFLFKKDLQEVLKYVRTKYGEKFTVHFYD